jgi:hypothetical protein
LIQAFRQAVQNVWTDLEFQVPPNADLIASGALANPSSIIGNEVSYCAGPRTVQVDAIVYHKEARTLRSYEVKRGFGAHDAGKRRSILRDALCMQLLLKSYGQSRGLDPASVSSHVIFYYGKLSVPRPFAIKGSELDEHFGFPVRDAIETVNDRFKDRLFSILAG